MTPTFQVATAEWLGITATMLHGKGLTVAKRVAISAPMDIPQTPKCCYDMGVRLWRCYTLLRLIVPL